MRFPRRRPYKRPGDFSLETKYAIHENAGHICERCKKRPSEQIHHILGLAIAQKYYPHLALDILSSIHNGRALCKECHEIEDKQARRNHQSQAERLRKIQEAQQKKREPAAALR